MLTLAGLRGKLQRRVKTTEEALRERLILQDLDAELDREAISWHALVDLIFGAVGSLKNKNLISQTLTRLYRNLDGVRKLAELDPYAFRETPGHAAARQTMGKLWDVMEKAGLLEYEEPSDAVKNPHEDG